MAFRVGQKVVCVDDSGWTGPAEPAWAYTNQPKRGEIYTVRDIGEAFRHGTPWSTGSHLCIRLEEIVNPPDPDLNGEWNFRVSRFRPLIEKKTETGMAILREILDRETTKDLPPVKKPQRVR